MTRFFIAVILSLTVLLSCNSDDDGGRDINCAAVLCAEGTSAIYLYLLDETSQDNLLDLGTIDPETTTVRDASDSTVEFTVRAYSNFGKFLVIPVDAEPYGSKSYTLNFENKPSFTISFDTDFEGSSECCGSYFSFDKLLVPNHMFEYTENGILPLNLSVFIK
ncbi:hypothetical protein [Allomuricauda sp. NBRC 101325]|uniref:hypothetical protein n=1 Tax=Allomuricauda sp. NBRC 101325 TaxID=1113758 RepID=UPI0024A12B07|nr:hypothetical protein [Muricauda sp. NBRC 101325]GLU43728.1 hypothetical protein Musp01_13520 [Muricauda sp. NBRC 101325]